jgi:hypothetical protein
MSSGFLPAAAVLSYSMVLFLLAAVTCAVAGFLYVYLPETKGKSLEQMLEYFTAIAAAGSPRMEGRAAYPVSQSKGGGGTAAARKHPCKAGIEEVLAPALIRSDVDAP